MKRSLPRVAAVSFSCPEQFHYQGFNFNFALQKQNNSCLLADVMRLEKCSALPCRKEPHGPQMGCPRAAAPAPVPTWAAWGHGQESSEGSCCGLMLVLHSCHRAPALSLTFPVTPGVPASHFKPPISSQAEAPTLAVAVAFLLARPGSELAARARGRRVVLRMILEVSAVLWPDALASTRLWCTQVAQKPPALSLQTPRLELRACLLPPPGPVLEPWPHAVLALPWLLAAGARCGLGPARAWHRDTAASRAGAAWLWWADKDPRSPRSHPPAPCLPLPWPAAL